MYLAAGVLSDDAGDFATVVQLQMLCRSGGEDFHGQVIPLDGVQHGILHMGATPAGTDGIVPTQQVFKLPVGHFQHALTEHGTVEIGVGGFF